MNVAKREIYGKGKLLRRKEGRGLCELMKESNCAAFVERRNRRWVRFPCASKSTLLSHHSHLGLYKLRATQHSVVHFIVSTTIIVQPSLAAAIKQATPGLEQQRRKQRNNQSKITLTQALLEHASQIFSQQILNSPGLVTLFWNLNGIRNYVEILKLVVFICIYLFNYYDYISSGNVLENKSCGCLQDVILKGQRKYLKSFFNPNHKTYQ